MLKLSVIYGTITIGDCMLYTDISHNKTSKLIMGCDYMGTIVSETEAKNLFDSYCGMGGNHFDTAHLYCDGESERVLGRWMKSKSRDSIFLSTKGGFPYHGCENSRLDEKSLRSDIEESLKRLKEEYVDLYYLHRDDADIPAGEIIETLNKFIKEGKTKSIGCSNWKAERIREANDYAKEHNLTGFCASQIKWSLAVTANSFSDDPTLVEMNEKELEFYKSENLKVIAFASQAKGFFSKYENGTLTGKARERYLCEKNIARFNAVKEIAKNHGVTIASIVIAYIISQKNPISLPIVGCKNTSQLTDTASCCDLILTDEEIKKLSI